MIKDYDVIVAKDISFFFYISLCLSVWEFHCHCHKKPFRTKTQLRELPLVLDQQD